MEASPVGGDLSRCGSLEGNIALEKLGSRPTTPEKRLVDKARLAYDTLVRLLDRHPDLASVSIHDDPDTYGVWACTVEASADASFPLVATGGT